MIYKIHPIVQGRSTVVLADMIPRKWDLFPIPSKKWDSIAHGVTILLGVFFIIVAVYLVSSYVPTIEWRGPIDYIAVWSYILAVIPAVFLLLQGLGVIFKGIDQKTWLKRHLALMILFIFFTHMAMVFGMADPQLTGYVPPQAPMHMEQGMNMNHDQMDMNHDQMHMNHDNAQMK